MARSQSCADMGCGSVTTSQTCNFPANPDIAGIGVLLSFFVSVTLSFVFALYGFYFIRGSYVEDQLTTLDMVITGPINSWIERFSPGQQPLITREVFREVILLFSDQQLITGLALLAVAFFRFKSITEYHFAVVSDLANMSLVVQFNANDILGEVLSKRPEIIWWRLTAFVTLSVLSMITVIPGGNKNFLNSFGTEMTCLWDTTSESYSTSSAVQMIPSLILDLWGIIDTLGNYFPVNATNPVNEGVRNFVVGCILWPRRAYISLKKKTKASTAHKIVSGALGGVAICLFVICEVLHVEALVLIRNWAMLLVCVIEVFQLKSVASQHGREGDEDVWGFGQAVPMFMLILPLCTLFELYWDGYFRRNVAATQLLNNQQDGLELSHNKGVAACSSTNGRDGRDDSSFRRQRLWTPLQAGSRPPSPASGHTSVSTAVPSLSIADETNSGNYYFGYPAAKMGDTYLEDQLYSRLWFRVFMRVLMTGVFGALTVAAWQGLAL